MTDHESKPGETSGTLLNGAAEAAPTTAYNGQPDDLHDLFGTAPTSTEDEDPLAALRNDPNYSALIKELEYIAAQARLLFEPAQEAPSDDVWTKIQSKLAEEPTDLDA